MIKYLVFSAVLVTISFFAGEVAIGRNPDTSDPGDDSLPRYRPIINDEYFNAPGGGSVYADPPQF